MKRNKLNKDTKRKGIKVKKKVARLILEKRTFLKLKDLLKKAHQSSYAKKINPKDFVQKSISLITDEHFLNSKTQNTFKSDHI